MGNAALCAGRASHADAVTVLKADGNVLTFESTVRVADLILEFPNHFMCHSSSLLLLQQVKILPLGTTLIPGEVYFLVPIPGQEIQDHGPGVDEDCDTDSLLHIDAPQKNIHGPGRMKFVISPEHFAKIMSGSVLKEGRSKLKRQLSKKLQLQPKKPSPSSNVSWQPRLPSIGEVEACK
ncbi:hypothetical protein KC19_11G013900 [Ceratodon purpureus]|uniref:Uncharacterized protein n=1 Tax=Ceratodon purpureus TaxID=3225 RepID=A0A8T0GA33_CERPU|nr:hypothetical protein KC19_11G013900 [Ceratodon purpureus]